MTKLNWRIPNIGLPSNFSLGSDTSPVNIYLLRKKYNIEVAELNGILFRRYNGANANRRGYGFPLSANVFDLNKAIRILADDSQERGENLSFCLCNEKQCKEIDKFCNVDWKSFGGDSDYIYSRESFARFSGRKFHAKKNLFNKFIKTYTEAEYLALTPDLLPDALNIAEKCLSEHEDDDTLQSELSNIREAVDNWENLGMNGGILYADGEPAAMIMFSALSEQCIDVHFEKSTNNFATDGAFAAINKFMASSKDLTAYKYINREEDMGLIGLQKSKESYRPDFKLKKYYGEVFG